MGGAYGPEWVVGGVALGDLSTVGRPHAAATSLISRSPALLMKVLLLLLVLKLVLLAVLVVLKLLLLGL